MIGNSPVQRNNQNHLGQRSLSLQQLQPFPNVFSPKSRTWQEEGKASFRNYKSEIQSAQKVLYSEDKSSPKNSLKIPFRKIIKILALILRMMLRL